MGLLGHWAVYARMVGYYSGRTEDVVANIGLVALDQIAWGQLAQDPGAFAAAHMLTLGAEPDLLRSVGQQTVALLQRTGATPPWTGYLAVDRGKDVIVGTCSFTAPPDADGVVEIAYFTFPALEGRGYATAMAAGLLDLAEAAPGIQKVRAHTLPEPNASSRILEKLGFERIGETVDPDVGQVWRWERDCHLPSNCHGSGPYELPPLPPPRRGGSVAGGVARGSKQEPNRYSGRRTLIARTPFLIVRANQKT